jgi:hypothetical protein
VDDDRESIEATNSLRFTFDMSTTGNGASDLPQNTTPPEPTSLRNNPYVNAVGGLLVGVVEGIVPGSALSYSLQDALGEHDGMAREARFGRSFGQIVGGLITTGIGLAGEAAATGFVLTGIGSVVGVPVATVSTVAVVSGAASVLAGVQGLARLMTQPGTGGGGGSRAPPASTPKQDYHGNDLRTTKPTQGYTLRDRNTQQVVKYGETTRGKKRYSKDFYEKHNVDIFFEAKGTKAEMHKWQHEKILEHKANNSGQRPVFNKSDW